MKAFPANHLVLEIAADRTSLGKARNIAAALLGIIGVGALKIDRQR